MRGAGFRAAAPGDAVGRLAASRAAAGAAFGQRFTDEVGNAAGDLAMVGCYPVTQPPPRVERQSVCGESVPYVQVPAGLPGGGVCGCGRGAGVGAGL